MTFKQYAVAALIFSAKLSISAMTEIESALTVISAYLAHKSAYRLVTANQGITYRSGSVDLAQRSFSFFSRRKCDLFEILVSVASHSAVELCPLDLQGQQIIF